MLSQDNTGLVIVDIQGKLARIVDNSEALIANCRVLIEAAKQLQLPIVWLEQNPQKLGATVDELSELLDGVSPITKFSFSGCEEPQFMQAIEQAKVDNWLICGIETHICVYQTALGLEQRNYRAQVVSDCVSSRTAANKQLALDKLKHHGVGITGIEMCLYEMVKDCRSAHFKPLLQLIR